jgi:hypothetical protein
VGRNRIEGPKLAKFGDDCMKWVQKTARELLKWIFNIGVST